MQTLKEQVLWVERFDAVDELRTRVRRSARDYWLLERHDRRAPRQGRAALHQAAMARSPR